jgi:hypothetical protein
MDTRAQQRGVLLVMHFDDADMLRRALAHSADGESPSMPDCLDEHTIAALAEGSLSAESRSSVLPHVAACARCRGAVASVALALADPDVAAEIRAAAATGPSRVHRIARIALPLAAAAALLLVVRLPGVDDGGPPINQLPPVTVPVPGTSAPTPAPSPRTGDPTAPAHRAPPITAAVAPNPTAPVGAVADARALRWDAVPGADRYRVTLFDAEGVVLYETELPGTRAPLPDAVVLASGRTYYWRVEARTGFDRWAASDLIGFSIAAGRP